MSKPVSLDGLGRYHGSLKIFLSGTALKTTMSDEDTLMINDSEDLVTINGTSNVKKLKRVRVAVLKALIQSYIAAAQSLSFKGTLGTGGTITALPTTYAQGDEYAIITAGTYAGQTCEIGDLIMAVVARSGSGNLNADWVVLQKNIDGAVTGPSSSTDGNVVLFNGTTGKIIKDSGISLSSKLDTTGAGTSLTIAFTAAGSRALPATGETLAVMMGKVVKYLTDLGGAAYLSVGTGSGDVAAGNHAHGNITTDGKIGSTADLPVVTGTNGALAVGAWATDAEIDAIVV